MAPRKVLECHSKGDTDYSALHAKVEVFGKVASIEHHYQMSKRFEISRMRVSSRDNYGEFEDKVEYSKPDNWKEAKGKKPDKVRIGPYLLDPRFLTQWYKLLWLKYLDNNPDLVEYAKGFDEFHDLFRGKSVNCQADVIKQYVKEGRESIVEDCRELLALLKINKLEEENKKKQAQPTQVEQERMTKEDLIRMMASLSADKVDARKELERAMAQAQMKRLEQLLYVDPRNRNKCSEIPQE